MAAAVVGMALGRAWAHLQYQVERGLRQLPRWRRNSSVSQRLGLCSSAPADPSGGGERAGGWVVGMGGQQRVRLSGAAQPLQTSCY